MSMEVNAPKTDGKCAICGESAHLACSNCRRAFYCEKKHQRVDWPRHKNECRAWEIRETNEFGRHIVARRDLRSGDVIISESPLVWGPAPHVSQRVCIGCGKQFVDDRCPKCAWPACAYDCEGLLDKNSHGLECALLSRTRIIPRCEVLLVIRMLVLWRTKSKRWDTLSKLQSHEESRGPGTEAHEEVMNVANQLAPLLSIVPECKDVLPKICGLIDVKALDAAPPEGTVAIYEISCLLGHSCLANTRHSFSIDDKGRPRITVTAVSDIKKDERLTTMYTHALWSTRARRDHLLATKYFTCRCARCADPTEFGTHIGTLKCPCKNGFILPKDPLDFETEWSCDSCPGVLLSTEVAQLTDRLEEEVDEALKNANMNILSDLLSRLLPLLHPGHQHCITVSHSLIQLLPSTDRRKAELCKRILNTVTALDPYGARLALYTATALRELAMCPGENRKELLLRALALLRLEPPNSPGQKLMRLIIPELDSS